MYYAYLPNLSFLCLCQEIILPVFYFRFEFLFYLFVRKTAGKEKSACNKKRQVLIDR